MGISKKMEELKYERARVKYLKQVIPKIGIIEEWEDRITCYTSGKLNT